MNLVPTLLIAFPEPRMPKKEGTRAKQASPTPMTLHTATDTKAFQCRFQPEGRYSSSRKTTYRITRKTVAMKK